MSMSVADLYIRVSTDEQADKGYSQRNQEEVLKRYCDHHNIMVRKVIFEDHSAKTFNRPRWIELLTYLKKSRGRGVDKILFTKWDRFSRNAGDAYQMINTLRNLDVEPQAIEQPLDLNIPENKMMLAIYLAAPEVENDRRALNIFHGMRRALKEGRYLRKAPFGYINRMEGSRKFIALKEPEASIVKWVFNTILKKRYPTENIWEMVKKKGLKISRSHFHRMVRNPLYCGKIYVPAFKDEEDQFVNGQHEPLISEGEFYRVQNILEDIGRDEYLPKVVSDDRLPLRGFLVCPKCGKVLTGSGSKGRSRRYYYYHCLSKCGFREKASLFNDQMVIEMKRFTLKQEKKEIFSAILHEFFKYHFKDEGEEHKKVAASLESLHEKLKRSRDLLVAGDLEADDYREIKSECNREISSLENQLAATKPERVSNYSKYVDRALERLSRLDLLYENGDVETKRELIGSIFPEKLCFSKTGYRTGRINSVVECIYQINNGLRIKKNERKTKKSSNSHWVELAVRGSNSFLEEMEMIEKLMALGSNRPIKPVL
ncbi:recombinase family protein [Echinicola rosea]|nr:recombinase family protein [Echinicola rosea]